MASQLTVMMESDSRLEVLFKRYVQNLCSEEEIRELFLLSALESNNPKIDLLVESHIKQAQSYLEMDSEKAEYIYSAIVGHNSDKKTEQKETRSIPIIHRVHFLRRWGWAVAIILLLAGPAAYFLLYNGGTDQKNIINTTANVDVAPGRDGAILTLADGSQVVLDSVGNGIVSTHNGVVIQLKNNMLSYHQTENENGEPTYNTLSTPRGRQFHIQLPDGTEVWLNAASSIKYPTSFTGKSRKVELSGEAYFEVAARSSQPFIVIGGHQEVQVLGTAFNMNCYADEVADKTTLLVGAVKIRSLAAGSSEARLLKPGQQAITVKNTAVVTVEEADVQKAVAWKNGLFEFEHSNLTDMMRQLARWYDVDVEYRTQDTGGMLGGSISKHLSLQEVLYLIEANGIHHFKIEGNKVIVLP